MWYVDMVRGRGYGCGYGLDMKKECLKCLAFKADDSSPTVLRLFNQINDAIRLETRCGQD
jgi:hypothetical protein